MTIHAIIKEGKIIPTEPLPFAEGTQVTVSPETPDTGQEPAPGNLSELFLRFAGVIDDLPSDLSTNHDHYLYGCPKKTR